MRRLTTIAVPGSPSPLTVAACDNPGHGDPNLRYDISGLNTVYNSAANAPGGYPAQFTNVQLIFHDDYNGGLIPNGVTENAVIATLIDHLHGKQGGPRVCQENAVALEYLAAAMQLLTQRDLRLSSHVLVSPPLHVNYAMAS